MNVLTNCTTWSNWSNTFEWCDILTRGRIEVEIDDAINITYTNWWSLIVYTNYRLNKIVCPHALHFHLGPLHQLINIIEVRGHKSYRNISYLILPCSWWLRYYPKKKLVDFWCAMASTREYLPNLLWQRWRIWCRTEAMFVQQWRNS